MALFYITHAVIIIFFVAGMKNYWRPRECAAAAVNNLYEEVLFRKANELLF